MTDDSSQRVCSCAFHRLIHVCIFIAQDHFVCLQKHIKLVPIFYGSGSAVLNTHFLLLPESEVQLKAALLRWLLDPTEQGNRSVPQHRHRRQCVHARQKQAHLEPYSLGSAPYGCSRGVNAPNNLAPYSLGCAPYGCSRGVNAPYHLEPYSWDAPLMAALGE